MKNKDIITELYEEELNMDSVEVEAEEIVVELKSKKSNTQWVLDSDVLEEIEIGVQSNNFAQVSIRITLEVKLDNSRKNSQDRIDLLKEKNL